VDKIAKNGSVLLTQAKNQKSGNPEKLLKNQGKRLGGRVWESNPSGTFVRPPTGFEVQKAR